MTNLIAANRIREGRPLVSRLVYSDGTHRCWEAINIKTGNFRRFKTQKGAVNYAYKTRKTRRNR